MVIKLVTNYTQDEIDSIITTLHILENILTEQNASAEMQKEANDAFEELADLLCLDEDGETAFHQQGW